MAIPRTAATSPSNAWGPLPPHATATAHPAWRWLERLMLVVAILSLGYYGYVSAEAYLYQAYEARELESILQGAPKSPAVAAAPVRQRTFAPGDTIGRLDIPRLGVSTIVRAGSDARTLRLAVGHIAGTAYPGEPGNVGLAGHRDTFFRKLRDIRPDDVIRVITPDGTFTYRVAHTTIVNPTDVWVLNPTAHPALTLVTCYPFSYIGSAPQRFIVRAELEGPLQAAALRP
jgi:sortase A